ncbi:BrnA antitoxin family protein [Gammaproteobacteria bacterium]
MKNNSDPIFERYENFDFTDAKPVKEIPALSELQIERGGDTRITIQVDTNTLAIFKAWAEMTGSNYQALMNDALRQYAQGVRSR